MDELALKSWAIRLAKRAGMKKAKVAVARKLGDHASHAGRWNNVRFCRCGGLIGRFQWVSGDFASFYFELCGTGPPLDGPLICRANPLVCYPMPP